MNTHKERDLIYKALTQFDDAYKADYDNRVEAYSDLSFAAGEQWPDVLKRQRTAAGRPCVTQNRMPVYIRTVADSIRNLNPAIKILPAKEGASEEQAELVEGLVRDIEQRSDAVSIYEGAGESAAACGIGHFRVHYEYKTGDPFNPEICIKSIYDPFAVYWDPRAKHPTKNDARYVFVTERISEKEFEEKYPDTTKVDFSNQEFNSFRSQWRSERDVVVGEYWYKKPVKKKYGRSANGEIVELDSPNGVILKASGLLAEETTVKEDQIIYVKMSGDSVLDGPRVWPGRHLPVVSVVGDELHLGDRVVRTSVIRHAKDAQRLLNYWCSTHTEIIALQPKSPYVAEQRQIEGPGVAAMWKAANVANYSVLPYKHVEGVPPPQRAAPPLSSQGVSQEMMLADQHIQATIGIFDAGIGQESNEKSGVAVAERRSNSQAATSIYAHNTGKAVEQCGRIIVDMIPQVYNRERIIRTLGEDGAQKMIPVNRRIYKGGLPAIENDLSVGTFDVRVKVGPSYATKKAEAAEGMMEFMRIAPEYKPYTIDLFAKAQDWPWADTWAERLKKTVPQGILAESEQEGMPQPSPQEMQMAQLTEQLTLNQAMARTAQMEFEAVKTMREAQRLEAQTNETDAKADKARAETIETMLAQALQGPQIQALIAAQVQQALQPPPAPPDRPDFQMEPYQPAPQAGFFNAGEQV